MSFNLISFLRKSLSFKNLIFFKVRKILFLFKNLTFREKVEALLICSRVVLLKSMVAIGIKLKKEEEKVEKIKREFKREKRRAVKDKKEFFIKTIRFLSIKIGKRTRRFFVEDLAKVGVEIREILNKRREDMRIRLAERIFEIILNRILSAIERFKEVRFSEIVDRKNKVEVVSGFLHVINLSSEGTVNLEQEKLFSDIIIRKT